MTRIKFECYCDQSRVFTFDELDMTEEQWESMSEAEKYKELERWADEHIDMGFKVVK